MLKQRDSTPQPNRKPTSFITKTQKKRPNLLPPKASKPTIAKPSTSVAKIPLKEDTAEFYKPNISEKVSNSDTNDKQEIAAKIDNFTLEADEDDSL